jgi:hypothetical protein
MKAPVYPTETQLATILADGWARGFDPEQTIEEAQAIGFSIIKEEVLTAWQDQDEAYEQFILKQKSKEELK